MISGRMDRKITLQEPATGTNAYGETTTTWPEENHIETFANVKQQSSREVFGGGKVSEVESVFTIRYQDMNETWRINYDSTIYEIVGKPREVGRRRFLEIMARSQT